MIFKPNKTGARVVINNSSVLIKNTVEFEKNALQ